MSTTVVSKRRTLGISMATALVVGNTRCMQLPNHTEVRVMKDFLRTSDLERDELVHLLERANAFKRHPQLHHEALRGQIVVLHFAKPSTRTRLSFEAAVARLGGVPAVVGPSQLQLGRGETIQDTARVVSEYAAAIVMRTFADEEVREVAQAASIPVVNALTNGHHPCQKLADLLTIRERFHHFADRKPPYVGDGNNVAHSLLEAAATVGMDIAVATPPGYAPAEEVVRHAEEIAEQSGSSIEVTNDPNLAVKDANVVYTDVWLSMETRTRNGLIVNGHSIRIGLRGELLDEAAKGALFMHCLPAHRGDEVAAEVIDGPTSVVFEQAANRLPTAQAILYALTQRHFDGRRSWC